MKKLFTTFLAILFIGFTNKADAQCDLQNVSDVSVQIVGTPITLPGGKCEVTVNITFNMGYNDGAKFVYFSSYLNDDYEDLEGLAPLDWTCGGATPAENMPTKTRMGTLVDEIGKSFMDIGFDLELPRPGIGLTEPVIMLTTYIPDPDVILYHDNPLVPVGYTPGLSVERTNVDGTIGFFEITGLKVIINSPCNSTIAVRTDIYGANASGATKAQCYLCGIPQFFNDPSITGFRNCSTPRQYSLDLTAINPVAKDIIYQIYIDMNVNGKLDPAIDQLAFTSGTISISDLAPYSSGLISLPPPYSNTTMWADSNYIIRVSGAELSNSVIKFLPSPGCYPLPVDYASFTATRNLSNVYLKWETTTEQNNTGFEIERNINGEWEEVGFVPSQALNGNSSDRLFYTFNDINTAKGITQYRIRQIDFNSVSKYSDIRTVRGSGQKGKIIVFPNPGYAGKVNILFDDANLLRDVYVIDMNGRVIRQINSVSSNSIAIENLNSGMYLIRVIVPETGMKYVKKIIVKNQ